MGYYIVEHRRRLETDLDESKVFDVYYILSVDYLDKLPSWCDPTDLFKGWEFRNRDGKEYYIMNADYQWLRENDMVEIEKFKKVYNKIKIDEYINKLI